MIRKILPVILALIGLGAGIGAGIVLRPAPEAHTEGAEGAEAHAEKPEEIPPELQPDYVKLSNQFIIPVVEEGRVNSMVVMSLSLEVTAGSTDAIYAKEPKLRDAFLQVLFDHANSGGFRGSFTDGANLIMLRKALLEVAQKQIPDMILDVLIAEIARQDS